LGYLFGIAGAHQLAPAERDEGTEMGGVQLGEALLASVSLVVGLALVHALPRRTCARRPSHAGARRWPQQRIPQSRHPQSSQA